MSFNPSLKDLDLLSQDIFEFVDTYLKTNKLKLSLSLQELKLLEHLAWVFSKKCKEFKSKRAKMEQLKWQLKWQLNRWDVLTGQGEHPFSYGLKKVLQLEAADLALVLNDFEDPFVNFLLKWRINHNL